MKLAEPWVKLENEKYKLERFRTLDKNAEERNEQQ